MNSKKFNVAIMQPYFLPYIGYWQLLNYADNFIVYDEIKYTKKGWINRNRFLQNGHAKTFTIPLEKDSDYLDISARTLSKDYSVEKEKILHRMKEAYRYAPFFDDGYHLLEEVLSCKSKNLFEFLFNSILCICKSLDIKTQIIISSKIDNIKSFKGEEKVLHICKILQATDYINSIGGKNLYKSINFKKNNINLLFLETIFFDYKQFDHKFQPNLSILDVIMFNGFSKTKNFLNNFKLIK